MAIYALNFIYNDIHSETFGVKIVNIDSGGLEQNNFGSNVTPVYDQIRRKHNLYLYGTQPTPNLEFNISITSEDELDSYSLDAIASWLFGKQQFGWLQIEQPSYEGIWLKCLLLDPKVISVGNVNYGFSCRVWCNSPYAFTNEYTYQYTITNNNIINFNNLSLISDYLYPTLIYTLNSTTTSFSITNQSDNNRVFSFTGLQANETITVDCEKQIITSSKNLNRLGNSNYNFFRLVPGLNILSVTGSGTLQLKMRFPKKVGG